MKRPLLLLCYDQIEAMQDVDNPRRDYRMIGFELWKRLSPILKHLSEEMKTRSMFKDKSVWVLDGDYYDWVLCESIEKKTETISFRIGIRSQGTFIYESFYLPADVEHMDWNEVVKWAIEYDNIAVPQGWMQNWDGSLERVEQRRPS